MLRSSACTAAVVLDRKLARGSQRQPLEGEPVRPPDVLAFCERGGRILSLDRAFGADGVEIAGNRVHWRDLFADAASHRDVLEMQFLTARINHSQCFSEGNGKRTLLLPPLPHAPLPCFALISASVR